MPADAKPAGIMIQFALHFIQKAGYLLQYDVKIHESVYTGGFYGILMFNIPLICYYFFHFSNISTLPMREIVLHR
jgi:hypothetical protein